MWIAVPAFCPVTLAVMLAGNDESVDIVITTPPPAGAVAGAPIVHEADAVIYLAATITTPPPACPVPPAPPRRNVGVVFDADTAHPRTAFEA